MLKVPRSLPFGNVLVATSQKLGAPVELEPTTMALSGLYRGITSALCEASPAVGYDLSVRRGEVAPDEKWPRNIQIQLFSSLFLSFFTLESHYPRLSCATRLL
jgi:hypothetical protein